MTKRRRLELNNCFTKSKPAYFPPVQSTLKGLMALPNEIFLMIVEFLCFMDVSRLSLVCKTIYLAIDPECLRKAIDRSPLGFASSVKFHSKETLSTFGRPFLEVLFNLKWHWERLDQDHREIWKADPKIYSYKNILEWIDLDDTFIQNGDVDLYEATYAIYHATTVAKTREEVIKSMAEASSIFLYDVLHFYEDLADDESKFILVLGIEIVTNDNCSLAAQGFEWTNLVYQAYQSLFRHDQPFFHVGCDYDIEDYFISVPNLHQKIFLGIYESYRTHARDDYDDEEEKIAVVVETEWPMKSRPRPNEKDCTLYRISIREF